MFAFFAPFAQGCGPGGSGGPTTEQELEIGQIGQLFRAYKKGQKPPPKGLRDLVALEQGYPAAIASLKSKDVLLYWGAGLSDAPDASSTILAYHKDTPEKGGEVLMQDGTAKKMTAEEFKAARKPEGATTDTGPVPGARKK
ncbi:MAG TPA: hypothetical protein VGH33_23885 [Isosphaeraceae bacterium]